MYVEILVFNSFSFGNIFLFGIESRTLFVFIYTSFSESEDLKQSFKFYYNILEISFFLPGP